MPEHGQARHSNRRLLTGALDGDGVEGQRSGALALWKNTHRVAGPS